MSKSSNSLIMRGGGGNNPLNAKKFFLNSSSCFRGYFVKSSKSLVNISIVASLALSPSLSAANLPTISNNQLPSGGKFVNGTGSIATNGNKMDIAGNNKNNVIAWGGGFNIGKEASVNFTTNQKNYLNLDYTNKASQILGKLNGGTNNIYLVNPSGVLIGKDASINANKFGVSTSPFDNNAIQTFSNNGSFSPVFSANKGDIVNMGTISANEIVLVGNRVTNVENYVDEKGRKQVAFGSFNKKDSLTNTKLEITANHTDLHANRNTIGTIDSINVTAEGNNAKIEVGQSATGWTDVQLRINQNGNVTITTYASIKDTEDWSSFTDIINGGNANNIDTFKLIKDVDFKNAGAIEPVGNDTSNPFSGNFYGNGHTLSNLLINADGKNSAGLFGYINGGSVQDLTIDGLNFQGSASVIGGFAGRIDNGTFSNIVLNNIGDIVGDVAGGFAGWIDNGIFSNIVLNNIGDISGSSSAGGFAGLGAGTFSNIVLNNIGNISDNVAGGFVGRIRYGTFSNIVLNNIGDISGFNGAGGFAGQINNGTFSNIALNNIGEINSELNSAGGFVGQIGTGTLANIVLNNIGNISGDHAGGFAGTIRGTTTLSNITLNNIKNISGADSGLNGAGGFAGVIGNGYTNINNIVLNNISGISGALAGGFAGQINNGTLSNITLNKIENISGVAAGGFAGQINNGTLSNITLNKIENISGFGAGGFAGTIIGTTTLSNITLNNIKNISGADSGLNGAGGFAGVIGIGYTNINNIVLNNISGISSADAGGFIGTTFGGTLSTNITLNNIKDINGSHVGGFIGQMSSGEFSNIVLNNIGDISGDSSADAGGFAGLISGGTSSNIVLNNIENISGDGVGGFAGQMRGSLTFSNIYFYGAMNLSGNNTNQNHINSHNQTALNLTNTTDLQIIQNHMQNGSTLKNLEYVTGTNGNSYLYMVTNGKIGDADSEITFDGEEYKLLQSGSTLKNLEYVIGTNGNSYLHMVTNGKIGDADSKITFDNEEYKLPKVSNNTPSPTTPSISNGDNLSSVTLVKDDFAVEVLKLIIDDILKQSFEFDLNHLSSLESILDEMDLNNLTTENIQTILMTLLVNGDEANKESIKQSLEFYAEFNKGEINGLKAEFEKWYGNDSSSTYNSSMKKYEGIAASIETLKNYVNGTLKPKLERIQSNLNRFEFLKAEIARLDKVYQEALENKLLPSDQLEIIYKDTKEKIDAYYTEAKGLLATLKEDNKPFLEALIGKTYNFKDKYNDVTGSFSFVGSNIGGNIESSINGGLGDKPILTLPDNDDSGNNQTIDGGNSAEIANTLAKQTKLASKEAVITLPAQEKEDVITEDERELGRACIVSDNAKTNNPCVAAF